MSLGGKAYPQPRSWAAPTCPDCETDVFVARGANADAEWYTCHFCGRRWSA